MISQTSTEALYCQYTMTKIVVPGMHDDTENPFCLFEMTETR